GDPGRGPVYRWLIRRRGGGVFAEETEGFGQRLRAGVLQRKEYVVAGAGDGHVRGTRSEATRPGGTLFHVEDGVRGVEGGGVRLVDDGAVRMQHQAGHPDLDAGVDGALRVEDGLQPRPGLHVAGERLERQVVVPFAAAAAVNRLAVRAEALVGGELV